MKHRKKGNALRWTGWALGLIGAAVALYGFIRLVAYGVDYVSSQRTSGELRGVYYSEPTAAATENTTELPSVPTLPPTPSPTSAITAAPVPTPAPLLPSAAYPHNPKLEISSRFKQLRKQSKNIVGWLSIDHLIDEAVAQRDNEYYLDHDALGKKNVNGAIFLDDAISLKTRPYTYVLYGHNMKSGAMFGSLRNYEKLSYYRGNPFIAFDTMYEQGRYVIFAVGTVSMEQYARNYVDFYALRSSNVRERAAAIEALKSASVHSSPIDVQPDDQLLLLVTCVDKDEERRVVVARRIRDGENETELKKIVERSWKKP